MPKNRQKTARERRSWGKKNPPRKADLFFKLKLSHSTLKRSMEQVLLRGVAGIGDEALHLALELKIEDAEPQPKPDYEATGV